MPINVCPYCRKPTDEKSRYGFHEGCFLLEFNLDELSDFTGWYITKTDKAKDSFSPKPCIGNLDATYHGAFRKYSAQLGKKYYIIKLNEPGTYNELVEVEYLTNTLAKAFGLKIPNFHIMKRKDRPAFLSEDFTKGKAKGPAIALEHLTLYLEEKSIYNAETIIKIIDHVSQIKSDTTLFAFLCLFDSLVGNGDRHSRNIGFLRVGRKVGLSPFYDNVSEIALMDGLLESDLDVKGAIKTGGSNEPTIKHYVQELKRLKADRAIELFSKKIKRIDFSKLVFDSFCSDPMKTAIDRFLQKRLAEFKGAL